MTRVGQPVPPGSHSRSAPTASMSSSMPLQGGGDGDLAHRLGQLAVADHQALDADREVAADRR